jgi:hypothetical protein
VGAELFHPDRTDVTKLTVGEEGEKKILCDHDLQKSYQKLTSAAADTENVALLTDFVQYPGGSLYLLPGLLAKNC